MRPDRLPRPTRLSIYAAATVAVLYVCLAPVSGLPVVSIWDKAEHAVTWAGLTLLGHALSPRRTWAIPAFTLALGAAVEVLQATMALGRTGDWRDLAADTVGIAAAVLAFALLRRRGAGVRQGS